MAEALRRDKFRVTNMVFDTVWLTGERRGSLLFASSRPQLVDRHGSVKYPNDCDLLPSDEYRSQDIVARVGAGDDAWRWLVVGVAAHGLSSAY
jgi:hypothetical protein